MAKALNIKAQVRTGKNPNVIRKSGFIPATVYGHGYESISVQINGKEFSKIPYKAYSHINELEINGEKYPVIIRDVQIDPVKDCFLNIEFYRIKTDEKIKVKVPVKYIGHSQAIIAGGVLIVSLNEIEIQSLPKDIPDEIEVNLEQILEIGQSIQVKDLKVDDKIQILTRLEEVLVKVEIAKTHEIEEAVAPTALPGEVPLAEAQVAEGAASATATVGKEPKAPETKVEKSKEK